MAKFNLEAKTIIESATLELDARQLEDLANAAPHLQEVCEFYDSRTVEIQDAEFGDTTGRSEASVALDPVMELLSSIASLVDQAGTIAPKRRKVVRRKNPTSGG